MYAMLLLALAQPDVPQQANRVVSLPPQQGVAVIDAKGILTLARLQPQGCYGSEDQSVTVKGPGKNPQKVKAKVSTLMVTVVEVPAHVVAAHTADGKEIAPAKLAQLLTRERTVLVAAQGNKVDPFHLQLFQEGTIVLTLPANLANAAQGLPAVEDDAIPPPIPRPDIKIPDIKFPEIKFPEIKIPDVKLPDIRKERERREQDVPPRDDEGETLSFVAVPVRPDEDKEDDLPPGSIGGLLRLRAKLSRPLPIVSEAALTNGALTLTRHVIEYTAQTRKVQEKVPAQVAEVVIVNINGQQQKRTVIKTVYQMVFREVTVNVPVARPITQTMQPDSIKPFIVTSEGKLEPIAAGKLGELLAKPRAVLIGPAEVEPGHLDLLRPGTLYLGLSETPRAEPKE